MASLYSVADLLDMLRRRIWVILGMAVLGSLLSVVFALRQPLVFSSTEVIQVTMPKVTGDLAKPTVDGSSARRIQPPVPPERVRAYLRLAARLSASA